MIDRTQQIIDECFQEAIADDAERRRQHRKPFLRLSSITIPGESPTVVPAFCRDISRTGIGLMHETALEMGRQFKLSIPLIGRCLEVQCQTKWCSCVGENRYFSGNAYRCTSTPQSFFLLSAVLSEELNRRLQQRFPFFRPATLDSVEGNQQKAFCRDISRSGIGLIHREPVIPGLMVVSISSSSGEDIVGTADIRHCEPMGEGWYTSGGKFPITGSEDLSG